MERANRDVDVIERVDALRAVVERPAALAARRMSIQH